MVAGLGVPIFRVFTVKLADVDPSSYYRKTHHIDLAI